MINFLTSLTQLSLILINVYSKSLNNTAELECPNSQTTPQLNQSILISER